MKAVKHEVYHGDSDHCFTAFREFFIVLAQAAVASKPSKRSFHHPAMWKHFETFHLIASFYDFQNPAAQLVCPLDEFSRISSVSPNELQAGELSREFFKQQPGAISILNIGRMDNQPDQQTHCIHSDVTLAAFYFLPGVIAANPFFSVVFTDWLSMTAALGLGSPPGLAANFIPKCVMNNLPRPIFAKTTKVVIHRAPTGEIMGQ